MLRRCLLAGLVAGLCASVLFARPGTVKTKDGRTMSGDVTEKSDTIVVVSRGVEATFPRDSVESIEYADKSVQDEYKERLAKLPADATATDHLQLAKWLFEKGQYESALAESEKAMKIDPRNEDARTLSETVRRQMVMDRPKLPGDTTPPGTSEPGAKPPVTPPKRKVLSPEQIQIIKLAELTRRDLGLRVRFENNVIKRYLDATGQNAAEFQGLPDLEKASAILKNGVPEMRKDVKILNDPAAIAEFRRVQQGILTGCASVQCHGGANAGKFVLVNPANNDEATYTNFYMLSRYAAGVKTPEGQVVKQRLIARTVPDQSLLLKYGLPRETSDTPHPAVANFRAMFNGTRDAKYQAILGWINNLVPIEPDYGIDFGGVDAGTGATSRPAGAGLP